MNRKLTISVMATCLLAAQGVSAGAIRCGGQIIEDSRRTGPGKYEVMKKCGQPTAQLGNTWIYERGGSKKVIQFQDNGKISSIKDG